ncbi:MAG TPA: AEC family transporter [Bacillota bacterium]|nr:AEC family transporter [Bacillota bacterium]
MNNNPIFHQALILFLIMAVGFYAKKRRILTNDLIKGLTELLINITVPLLTIASFNFDFSPKLLYNIGVIFAGSLGIHTLAFFLSKILFNKCAQNEKKVLQFSTVFSNCAFMGFPVLVSIYGKIGILYGSVYVVPFTIFLWTVGIWIYRGQRDSNSLGRIILNPGIVAVIIGLIIFSFSIKLPTPLYQAIDLIGSMTTPLAMIIIGAMLAGLKIKEVFGGLAIYYGTLIRLLLTPILVLGILILLGMKGVLLGVCVISTAMPTAANTVIFAEKFNGDATFASRIVFVSTLFSILTIPALLFLVGKF